MATVDIIDNTSQTLDQLHNAVARALEIIGGQAETYAKMLCPVDTGRLRNSIAHTADGKYAYIGSNVEYAPYVELGTIKQQAQPYLRPAAQDHMPQYKAIIQAELHKG